MSKVQVQVQVLACREEFDVEVVPMAQTAPHHVPAPNTPRASPTPVRLDPHPDVVAALARLVLGARPTGNDHK